ncbi:alpha/beta fold hydrolase [Chthonobacter rhizosphaerae]|uniref:alpha/beta fold hydrolase n=1 Tax=Chthonobacter rhizosphaerae TaxID=2735553 RepID=UPI0015EE505B|nr:alpha/beta fold hydrolase [Chthonobacter rhizosphaerae]
MAAADLFFWPARLAAEAGRVAADMMADLAGQGHGAEEPASAWATPHAVRLALPSLRLRDYSAEPAGPPTLVVAPYALHHATLADFAPGHSLMQTLRSAGLTNLFLAEWRSATPAMRFLTVDSLLADLNVAVDDIGGRVRLIGLCQGGWMALLFAARFPDKVESVVAAGAPLDTAAGSSLLTVSARATPSALFETMVEAGGGRVLGDALTQAFVHAAGATPADGALGLDPADASAEAAALRQRFDAWVRRTVDLPGPFFLQTVTWMFKENRLVADSFPALGRSVGLGQVRCPVLLLAATSDELVSPRQVFAAAGGLGSPAKSVRTLLADGPHLGLFMGLRTLEDTWPEIAGWIAGAGLPSRHRSST